MSRSWKKGVSTTGILAVVIAVVLLWPAHDPLAGVETVAVRMGGVVADTSLNLKDALEVDLGERNIQIVSDEATADAVIELTDLNVNLGDIEISISDAGVRGEIRVILSVRDVQTERAQLMDFYLRFDTSGVRADLVARKFWHVWKRRPSA